jgi:hypothetical protein
MSLQIFPLSHQLFNVNFGIIAKKRLGNFFHLKKFLENGKKIARVLETIKIKLKIDAQSIIKTFKLRLLFKGLFK